MLLALFIYFFFIYFFSRNENENAKPQEEKEPTSVFAQTPSTSSGRMAKPKRPYLGKTANSKEVRRPRTSTGRSYHTPFFSFKKPFIMKF